MAVVAVIDVQIAGARQVAGQVVLEAVHAVAEDVAVGVVVQSARILTKVQEMILLIMGVLIVPLET